jgi:hypothetical protein
MIKTAFMIGFYGILLLAAASFIDFSKLTAARNRIECGVSVASSQATPRVGCAQH